MVNRRTRRRRRKRRKRRRSSRRRRSRRRQRGGRRRRRSRRRRGGAPTLGWIQEYTKNSSGSVTLFIVRGKRPNDPEQVDYSDDLVLYNSVSQKYGQGPQYWIGHARNYAAVTFEELKDSEGNAYTNHLALA